MLKRKAYQELVEWKNTHKNDCLMVKGARQVGKTFLVREFGKKEYKSFIEINLEVFTKVWVGNPESRML